MKKILMFARTLGLIAFGLSAVGTVAMIAGCAGTKAAYQAAQSPEDYAYVVTEHYASVLHELAAAKQAGKLTGSALATVQKADDRVNPAIIKLRSAAELYTQTKDAKDAVALQQAIDQAVPLLADLIKLMKKNGVDTTALERNQMWLALRFSRV